MGRIYVAGDVSVPHGAALEAIPLAMLVDDVDSSSTLRLRSALVEVEVFSSTNLAIANVRHKTDFSEARYVLHNVTMEAKQLERGWTGATWGTDAVASLQSTSRANLAMVANETFTTSLTPAPRGDDVPVFTEELRDPHLRVDTAFAGAFQGPVNVKVNGPSLAFHADENDTTIATGSIMAPGNVQESQRWVVVRTQDAKLEFRSVSGVKVAVAEADVSWSGPALFGDAFGEFGDAVHRYRVAGSTLRLEGDLTTKMAPQIHDHALVLQADLSGDLRSTSAMVVTQPPQEGAAYSWLLAAFLLVAVPVGIVLVVLVVRRRLAARDPPLSSEDLLEMANMAAGGGQHGLALEWIERALARGPETARLRVEQGAQLAALGDVEGALRAYARAEALTEDGEPAYLQALLLEQTDAEPSLVESHLRRALDRTPVLALEAESDFRRLRTRSSFRTLVRAAEGAIG